MARFPAAAWRPIGVKTTEARRITPSALITHSDAGYVRSLQGWWLHPASGSLACHLHVDWYGLVEQYVDSLRRAAANMAANGFALSIECSNSPDFAAGRVSFDEDPFSDEQVDALIQIHKWAPAEHRKLPAKRCTDGRRGFGWHGMYPQWTTPGHQCPGAQRVRQLVDTIYPAAIGGTPRPSEDVMNSAQDKRLKNVERYAKKAAGEAPKAALHAGIASKQAGIALSWMAHGGIPQGVTKIYREVLGRDPDDRGMASWSQAATRATYDAVRARIADTSEAKRRSVNA